MLLAATSNARSQEPQETFRWDGAWVMTIPGTPLLAAYTLSPIDSATSRAAIYGSTLIGDPTLMGAFTNAQYQTPIVGQTTITSSNTAVFTVLQYGMRLGAAGPEIVYITLNSGTDTVIGPDKVLSTNNISVYLPNQDQDGDGLPDAGQAPIACLSLPSIHTRLPLLAPCAPPPLTGPSLNLSRPSGNTLHIAWPDSASDFILQSASSLPSTNWVPVPGVANNQATIKATGEKRFYRLERQ